MPLLPPMPVVPTYEPPAIHWSASTLPAEAPDGWLALVVEGGRASLAEVRRVPPVDAPCSEDEECGGWCPTSTIEPEVPALMLLQGPGLSAGPLAGALVGGLLSPGAELSFRGDRATSHLIVTGAARDLPDGVYDSCTVQGVVTLRHLEGDRAPVDTAIWAGCRPSWATVRFAGDLDGDGVPEVLVEWSEGSTTEWTLWWSDPTHPGTVRLVSTNSVSDC